MISLATRGLLLSLGLVLALATARPAQAGGVLWGGTICVNPTDVSAAFTGSFASAAKCEQVCKIAAGVCKAAVKDAVECQKDSVGGVIKAFVTECSPLEGVEKETCLANLKAEKKAWAEDLAMDKETALGSCSMFEETCIMGCAPVL